MRDESIVRYRAAVMLVTIKLEYSNVPAGTKFWVGPVSEGYYRCKGLPFSCVKRDEFEYADSVGLAQFADACRTYQTRREESAIVAASDAVTIVDYHHRDDYYRLGAPL